MFSFFSRSHRLPLCSLLSTTWFAPLVSKVGLFSDPDHGSQGQAPM